MDDLVKSRGYIKAKLTRFTKYVNSLEEIKSETGFISSKQCLELQRRLDIVIPLLEEYDKVNMQIGDDLQGTEGDDDQMEFENSYFSIVSSAEDMLKEFKHISNSRSRSSSPNNSIHLDRSIHTTRAPAFNLPKISIPRFIGEPSNWLEFKSIFSSLIHENRDLTDIQKLHYLKGSLTGAAADVIKSLEFTSANYQIAYQALLSRYDQPKLLIRNHIKSILNLEPLIKESAIGLRNVSDSLFKHIAALKSLADQEELFETFIIHVMSSKLDVTTSRQWETLKNKSTTKLPSLEEFKSFLTDQANLIDSIEIKQAKIVTERPKANTKSFVTNSSVCALCKGNHYLSKCETFLKMSPTERSSKTKELKMCFNCLVRGHMVSQCSSRFTCKKCKARHHSLLHTGAFSVPSEIKSQPEYSNPQTPLEPIPSVSAFSTSVYRVLLPTATCNILDSYGSPHLIRVLLDSGSQSNFIRSDICARLKLPTERVSISVTGLGGSGSQSAIHSSCNVVLGACHSSYKLNVACLVLNEITGTLPCFKVNCLALNIPGNVHLSDPTFAQPGQIDLLIGSSVFFELLCIGKIHLGPNLPILQKTRFGWIISGRVDTQLDTKVQCHLSVAEEVSDQLTRFWEIETYPTDKILSTEEDACESHFVKHTRQDSEGRFIVSIPLKQPAEVLGDSFEIAKKRFLALERRLQNNPDLSTLYSNFMKEYLELGHMSLSDQNHTCVSYYLPHHGVLKKESLTTKLRVVFNGSQATSTGYSLNSIQMVGPVIQQDLFSILLRFRKYIYAISSDIEKMYRQVQIEPAQRSLQRILWRFSPEDSIQSYDLNTVTYGTASASFLAIRCLYQLGIKCEIFQPEISEIIKHDFYVDDLLTGADSLDQAKEICSRIYNVLNSGQFKLRKWISNNIDVLSDIPKSELHPGILNFGAHEHANTLGLIWSFSKDHFLYSMPNSFFSEERITKRTIISMISQIFDPLGLVGPCVIRAKILLQLLWLEKLSWDDSVPNSIQSKWIEYRYDLVDLNKLKIPRHVLCANPIDVQLHGFCDASMHAYGASLYLRSVDADNKVHVHLLCAKSRVAPIKPLTIPKLELCGALLLARLANCVLRALKLNISKIVMWSDSMIVLGWLKTAPNLLKMFVSNRIADIQRLHPDAAWLHVSTNMNAADLLSRGTTAKALINSSLWWHGPAWLIEHESSWPRIGFHDLELPELRMQSQCLLTSEPSFQFSDYSNLNRLERVISYCFRFFKNSSSAKDDRVAGPLTPKEIQLSQLSLVRIAQSESFAYEKRQFSKERPLKASSVLLSFHPFLDSEGIIRVGGRLRNSQLPFDKKHPILLSGKHHLSRLIVERQHLRLLHAGPQLIICSLREKFWITSCRSLAKHVVHNCVKCFRFASKLTRPIMGNLPSSRLKLVHPFHTTGVDYAGPLLIKDRKTRGAKTTKAYICLYICFATKAIHLELVSDLTTESFLLSFRRFVARRGKPLHVHSDNGTNFVGANSELRELGKFLKNQCTNLQEVVACDGINWHFAPGHSPHFGGLWEAGIKSCKYHLKRVVGNSVLTFEEMYTFLAQVEATLNSRPLCPISSDPNDLHPLTPSHFLIGRPLSALPDPDVTGIKEFRLSTFQRLQKLHQHLWSRWNKEYVTELQQRQKWKTHQSELKLGALVLIRENNLPPSRWKLGRVHQLHPGNDGVCRVATIKTDSGMLRRAFAKVCPLPVPGS